MPNDSKKQIPRRVSHQRRTKRASAFDYDLPYASLDLRKLEHLYRVGVGEQGVLLVEPYKHELLPLWRFKTPTDARKSAALLLEKFYRYRDDEDFVGMDMARKFLQMGFTRSRRYANHRSGRKYDSSFSVRQFEPDFEKAKSAAIFKRAWNQAEADETYQFLKAYWRAADHAR